MRVAALAIMLLTALSFQSADAKTLEEVLKEKGVITEADYQEVVKQKPANSYVLGKGFTFNSKDDRFQLSLGGRMQFRYSYFDSDARSSVSQWQAKRIKLYTGGHLYGKDLTYGFQADFANGGNPRILDDAWMNYRFIDELQIRVGQFKTPFVRQEITSDGNLELVDRSIVSDSFKQGRDMGAMLNGKIADGIATYSFGVFGGVGQSVTRSTAGNADSALIGRVVFNPLGEMPLSEGDLETAPKPLLSIGASYLMNTLKRSATGFVDADPATTAYYGNRGWLGQGASIFTPFEKIDIDAFGVEAAFKWMGLYAQGEFFDGEAKGTSSHRKLRPRGFYAEAGYSIIPKKLQAVFRYSHLDLNRRTSNDLQTEVIGGLSYYFDQHNLKIQGDVGDIHTQPARSDEMQYRVQAQVTF